MNVTVGTVGGVQAELGMQADLGGYRQNGGMPESERMQAWEGWGYGKLWGDVWSLGEYREI